MTKLISVDCKNPDLDTIKQAAKILNTDGLVAFPTETVYGLGGNGLSSKAITNIFQAKNRPLDNPVILHIHCIRQAEMLGYPPHDFYLLAEKFWPGPLTMIIPRKKCVPNEASGGLETVAVRMPANQVALTLIETAQLALAAPSANLSGRPSPTTAQHVEYDLTDKVDMILDGGATGVGLESTVVDLSQHPYQILRPGGITWEQLRDVLGEKLQADLTEASSKQMLNRAGKIQGSEEFNNRDMSVKSPGLKYTHYAPDGKLYLVEGSVPNFMTNFQEIVKKYTASGCRTGILLTDEMYEKMENLAGATHYRVLGSENNLDDIAHNIYDALREMDSFQIEVILCPTFENKGLGKALMNRLMKAAEGRILN